MLAVSSCIHSELPGGPQNLSCSLPVDCYPGLMFSCIGKMSNNNIETCPSLKQHTSFYKQFFMYP